ncbi:transglycosylase SLT domain-containing protein [Streptomyces albus]|uniref:transglycosylase SLT domain-containing protein n=1 Tax=Streptomyces albus TaxID=1888 RepID=UPI0006E28AF6|nr:transglycosylase SLT domain-containing protein [Streptomyces albus]
MRTTTLIPRRIATTGITVLGAAGIATAALTGTAHAAPQTAKPAHQTAAKAAAKPDKADDKADKKGAGKKAEDYPDNLDGWIREAMSIMKKHGIPGSYDGIKRNIIRESGGDPGAVNDWDINAQKGIPSKGLLQVIQPTFDQYHVKGTADKLTDPVANIVAACNYAADRYGTMDNVDSAY